MTTTIHCNSCRGMGIIPETLTRDEQTGYPDGSKCGACDGLGHVFPEDSFSEAYGAMQDSQDAQRLAFEDFSLCGVTHQMMESMAHDYALGQECARRGIEEPENTNIAFHAGFMDGSEK